MTTIDWTLDDLEDLTGTTAVITGGTRGVGLATAGLLREHGATVLVGARAGGDHPLDLGDPASVAAFATWVRSQAPTVDVLVNNAGISNQPFALAMGVESQLAVNHLGHFLLTQQLLPVLARVVTVTSSMFPMGSLDLATVSTEEGYTPGGGYVRSKLANVLFALELERRHPQVRSVLAHPGLADTSMHDTYPDEATTQLVRAALAEQGRAARPAAAAIVYAATAPTAEAGVLYGPVGGLEQPNIGADPLDGVDPELARQLWEASERWLTAASTQAAASVA